MRIRLVSVAIAAMMLVAAIVGVGYAYKALFTSNGNSIANDYVTINDGVQDTAVLNYRQDYVTYSVDGDVMYRLCTGMATDLVKLTDDPYPLKIRDSRAVSNAYTLKVTADLPTLYEDDEGNDWCRFVFELRQHSGELRWFGLNTMGSSEFMFYLDEGLEQDSVMGEGEQLASLMTGDYDLDVYLKLCTVGDAAGGKPYGVFVDKENFVDEFGTEEFSITFTTESMV